jgi:hypothetical protein
MRAILDDRADRAPVSRHVLLVAGVLWLLVVSGLGGVGLWTCSGQTAPPAPAQTSNADRRPAAG